MMSAPSLITSDLATVSACVSFRAGQDLAVSHRLVKKNTYWFLRQGYGSSLHQTFCEDPKSLVRDGVAMRGSSICRNGGTGCFIGPVQLSLEGPRFIASITQPRRCWLLVRSYCTNMDVCKPQPTLIDLTGAPSPHRGAVRAGNKVLFRLVSKQASNSLGDRPRRDSPCTSYSTNKLKHDNPTSVAVVSELLSRIVRLS
jgi:hypothetical protein